MTIMPAAYQAKEALLRDLQSPALLALTIEGKEAAETVAPDPFFHPLQGLSGLCAAHLLAPTGHSALLVKGEVGAHSPRVSVPQAVRVHVLQGALLLWRPGLSEDPVRVAAGQEIELFAGEQHGFVVLENCLNYNLYTPAFEMATKV